MLNVHKVHKILPIDWLRARHMECVIFTIKLHINVLYAYTHNVAINVLYA